MKTKKIDAQIVRSTTEFKALSLGALDGHADSLKRELAAAGFAAGDEVVIVLASDFAAFLAQLDAISEIVQSNAQATWGEVLDAAHLKIVSADGEGAGLVPLGLDDAIAAVAAFAAVEKKGG